MAELPPQNGHGQSRIGDISAFMHGRSLHYVLDENGEPKPCGLYQWAEWFEKAERHIGHHRIGQVRLSTVFLGLDHAWEGPPILWETMVFGGYFDQMQWRYHTREQAEAAHAALLRFLERFRGKSQAHIRKILYSHPSLIPDV